jgi:hypothetical protein
MQPSVQTAFFEAKTAQPGNLGAIQASTIPR